MTEQIYYSFWGAETEENKNYFKHMAMIADWIGNSMTAVRINAFSGEIHKRSNIAVLQTKEKFGSPRVYVQLSGESTLEDAKHYRQVYKEAIDLWPHYEKSIREGMDYEEYLFETEQELATHTAEQMKWAQLGKMEGHIDNDSYLQRLEAIRQESIFLKKVCNFT